MNQRIGRMPRSDIVNRYVPTGSSWELERLVGPPLICEPAMNRPDPPFSSSTLRLIAALLDRMIGGNESHVAISKVPATAELSLQDACDLLGRVGVPAHIEVARSIEDVAQIVEGGQRVLLWLDLSGVGGQPSWTRTPNGLVAVHGLVRMPSGRCDRFLISCATEPPYVGELTASDLETWWLATGAHLLTIDQLEPATDLVGLGDGTHTPQAPPV